ncbi:TPA: hypothetical protein ACGQS5_004786 [Serratia liquefaciens]
MAKPIILDGREPATPAPVSDTWQVEVSPYLWASSLRGSVGVGPLGGRVHAPFHDTVHDLDMAFMAHVAAEKQGLGLFLDGQYLDADRDLDVAGGALSADARLRSGWISLGAYYRTWQWKGVSVAPMAGLHWSEMALRLRVAGESRSDTVSWTVPFFGVRADYNLSPSWQLVTAADVGAWGRQYTLQGQAYAGYRLQAGTVPLQVRVGYRALHQDARDGEVHWDMTQYGPVIGLSAWF